MYSKLKCGSNDDKTSHSQFIREKYFTEFKSKSIVSTQNSVLILHAYTRTFKLNTLFVYFHLIVHPTSLTRSLDVRIEQSAESVV